MIERKKNYKVFRLVYYMGLETKDYYVGYLDALGFSNLIDDKKVDVETVYHSLERVCVGLLDAINGNNSHYWEGKAKKPNHIKKDILEKIIHDVLYFSDSIVFYIKCSDIEKENLDKLKTLCWLVNEVIAKSLIEPKEKDDAKQLAFRGSIAKGEMIVDKDKKIYVGKALKDAVKLSESQGWMGGKLHKSIEISNKLKNDVIKYEKIPIKKKDNGKKEGKYKYKEGYALNWFQHHSKDIKTYHLKKYDWGTDIEKKNKTMKFLKYLENNLDNQELASVRTDLTPTMNY